jgi:hypothetical protein
MTVGSPAPAAAGTDGPTAAGRIALYPVGLAIVLVFELLNVSGVSMFSAGRPFLISIVGAFALSALGRVLLGDRDRGGVFASLWVLALLGSEDVRLGLVIAIATGLLLLERYALDPAKQTIRWPRISRILSRVIAVFGVAVVVQGIQAGTFPSIARSLMYETPLRPAPAYPGAASTDPDLYLIMLDGHTRADVLTEVFGADGSAFTGALESHGFSVAPRSRSNYTQTAETLGSMFNQTQLRDIPEMADLLALREDQPPGTIVRDAINDNVTWSYLRDRGYEVDSVSSGFEQVALREADRFVDTGQINEFELAVLKRSLLGHVVGWLAPDAVSAQQRGRIQGVFDAVATAPSWIGDTPQAVFAHVPSPHPPWVFNADGSPRTVGFREEWLAETPASTGLTIEQLEDGYAGQVADVDRRLLEALPKLDAAIASRGRPAVVVVFSDHGTWIGADGGDIRLRFKDLLAVRGTGVNVSVAPNQTLVNLLPSLFDQLYGRAWTPQPDTQYRFGTESAFELYPVDDPDSR